MNIEMIMQYVTYALMAVGGLVLTVMIIVQGIKDLKWLKEVPTSVVTLGVSMILCILLVVIVCQLLMIMMIWYYFVGAVILAFFIHFVATRGWDGFYELWNRARYKKN